MLLSPKGYSPREAYGILSEAFLAETLDAEVATPILTWLRLSMHATRQNNAGPPVVAIAITSPFSDEDLLAHRATVLNQFLPNRSAPAQGLEAALSHFALAVTTQATEDRNARLARDLEREQPTTPSTKFGLLLDSLKNMLNVQEEPELPEFWFQFAAAKKKQEFSILREFLEGYARSEHAFINMAPITTPKLHADLSTITFVADHHDDLKTGIHPFVVMDGSEEFRASAMELSRSFGLLYEREYGVAFSDLNQFKVPKDLRSYPVTYFDLEQNLGLFGNLIGAILGNQHPITRNYRLFWNALTKQYRMRLRQLLEGPRSSVKPVHILRSVQLVCYDYFDAKRSQIPTPNPPDFVAILRNLSLGHYIPPLLPLPLYQLVTPRATPALPTPTPSIPGSIPTSVSSASQLNDASSVGLSTVTGATNLTGDSRKNTLIINEHQDSHLLTLIPFNRKIRDIMGNTQPPTTDDGQPICLAFHTKGGCYSNCRRRANHSHTLTLAEKERLENYIVDRLEKLNKP